MRQVPAEFDRQSPLPGNPRRQRLSPLQSLADTGREGFETGVPVVRGNAPGLLRIQRRGDQGFNGALSLALRGWSPARLVPLYARFPLLERRLRVPRDHRQDKQ